MASPITTTPEVASIVEATIARPAGYSAALAGKKSHTTGWNFLAAMAATATGIELRSIVGTVSGAAWTISQVEAWVDEHQSTGKPVIAREPLQETDWRTVAGIGLVLASIVRTTMRGNLKDWRWV